MAFTSRVAFWVNKSQLRSKCEICILTAGVRKCGIGGAVGLGLASIYCLWTARDRLQGFRQEYSPA